MAYLEDRLVCKICGKRSTSKSNLNRHVKDVHSSGKIQGDSSSRFLCPIPSCSDKFRNDISIREHLTKEHGIPNEVEYLEFDTEADYEAWLYSVQDELVAEYVKHSSTRTLASGCKRDYLHCNRSFKSITLENDLRKKKIKSKGSKKTGRYCPSRIEVTRKCGEKILVTFWKTHCGHEKDIGHIRLDKRSRREIAEKLAAGVSFDKILNDVRHETGGSSKRLKLLKRQDLYNIARDYAITYSKEGLKKSKSIEKKNKETVEKETVEVLHDENPQMRLVHVENEHSYCKRKLKDKRKGAMNKENKKHKDCGVQTDLTSATMLSEVGCQTGPLEVGSVSTQTCNSNVVPQVRYLFFRSVPTTTSQKRGV